MEEIRFDTVGAIHQRKVKLLDDIRKDGRKIDENWKNLFHREEPTSRNKRLVSVINTGAGILDGILLGWKLYRKFGKPFRFRR